MDSLAANSSARRTASTMHTSSRAAFSKFRSEWTQNQVTRVEHAARIGKRNGFARCKFKRATHRFHDAHKLTRGILEDPNRRRIPLLRRARDKLRQRGNALPRTCVGELRTEIKIGIEIERGAHGRMEWPPGKATIAHAGEDVEPLHRDPIGRAFIAESFAP